jgi:hypothetical protein
MRSGVSHWPQNLVPEGFSAWHRGHAMPKPPSSRAGKGRNRGLRLSARGSRGQGHRGGHFSSMGASLQEAPTEPLAVQTALTNPSVSSDDLATALPSGFGQGVFAPGSGPRQQDETLARFRRGPPRRSPRSLSFGDRTRVRVVRHARPRKDQPMIVLGRTTKLTVIAACLLAWLTWGDPAHAQAKKIMGSGKSYSSCLTNGPLIPSPSRAEVCSCNAG